MTTDRQEQINKMLYESNTLRLEMIEINKVNPGLVDVFLYANQVSIEEFGIPIVFTHLFRTQAKQDELYKNNAKYKKKKFKSPHQFSQAGDIRSRIYTDKQIKILVDKINNKFNATNGFAWTALCHDVGHGPHFHVQYTEKK